MDRLHTLGTEAGHWNAVRAMRLNSYLFHNVLGPSHTVGIVETIDDMIDIDGRHGRVAIVDPLTWLEHEARAKIPTPKQWGFTSDSIAAHVAMRVGALRLTLLKSTAPKTGCSVAGLSGLGLVDSHFEDTASSIPNIDLINMRATPPERFVLRQTP